MNAGADRELRAEPTVAAARAGGTGRPRLLVVGGGISGLAAAHRIVERAGDAVEIVLVESSDRLGGVIATERTAGFLLEGGPDSFVTDKPEATALARRVGLGDALIGTDARFRRTLIVRDGKLVALPEAFQLLAPARLLPFLRSPVLSWRGKLEALGDLVKPRGGPPPGGDESLASFVRRRLGREMLERVAQPMVGGIYTADPETLSLAATMPRFLDLEREQRSLILGLMRRASTADAGTSGARFGLFATLKDGIGSLVAALARRLPPGSVRLATRALALERSPAGAVVQLADGEHIAADGVVIALPAPRAAELLAAADPALAADLARIAYASSAIVSLAFARADVPRALDFFGVVVPEIERRRVIALSLSSVKYAGRAPQDAVLVRAFIGGALHPEGFALDDEQMIRAARAELRDLLGISAAPRLVRLHRWPESMPQYRVGHRDLVARIRARAAAMPEIALAGNAYDGVGMPDCVRSGEAAADRLLDAVLAPGARPRAAAGVGR